MSNLIPRRMSYAELADLLDDMARRVRAGDSYEGNIEYVIPLEDTEGLDMVEVRGTYRIGNLMGQGGMRMIGDVP